MQYLFTSDKGLEGPVELPDVNSAFLISDAMEKVAKRKDVKVYACKECRRPESNSASRS